MLSYLEIALKTQKKKSVTDRRTDILTNTVTYRDANVVHNSLNTQICASLPVNILKTQKKQSGTDRPTDRPTDRQTDQQTDIATYRAVIAAKKIENQ